MVIALGKGVPAKAEENYCDTHCYFELGYEAAGGDMYVLARVERVVQCESGWLVDPPGYYLGLAQFDPATWQNVLGFADYRDAYLQGVGVALLMSIASPASQWPVCWWRAAYE